MIFDTNFSNIIKRTHNVQSYRFSRPENFNYKAGQYMFITISTAKSKLRKHFTISSSPSENYLEFTKKLTDSQFSTCLKTQKVGDWVNVKGPYGEFVLESEHDKIAMLTGGIGITPFRSMIKYCLDRKLDNDITLLYSNRSERDIVFSDEFESMTQNKKTLKVVHTLTAPDQNWRGETGRISADKIKHYIADYLERKFYLCGPPAMVDAIETTVKKIGVLEDNIRTEDFSGY